MKKILVIAPHPDDETLGCGGTLLKHKNQKDKIYCLFITNLSPRHKYFKKRKKEIENVAKSFKFDGYVLGKFQPSSLEKQPKKKVIEFIGNFIKKIQPNKLLVPFPHDAHRDHKVCFDSCSIFFKSFRYNYIKEVWIYETLSETNFSENYSPFAFKPNTWVDINKFLKKKIDIFSNYKTEINPHPFPRSIEAIKSQALLRGSYANVKYAEAFQIIKNIV